MTRKAIIQGEIHVSQRDKRNLFDSRTDQTEALFIEGRSSTIQIEHSSMGYAVFLIGYLTLELLYLGVENFMRAIPKRDTWEIEDAAEDEGLIVHSEIDAELHEMWDMTDDRERWSLNTLALMLLLLAVVHGVFDASVLLIPDNLFPTIIVAGTPFLFSAFAIFFLGDEEIRDEIMANSISEITEEESYDEVLVLCGDKHVPGITNQLRDCGWEVDAKRSDHPIAPVSRLL